MQTKKVDPYKKGAAHRTTPLIQSPAKTAYMGVMVIFTASETAG